LKILLRAPLLTNSGYGVHSRQVFKWLKSKSGIKLDVECLNWGSTPWLINENYEDGTIGEIMSHSKKLEPPYDITFQLQLPDEWDPNLGKINVGMSAVVETDKCNPAWLEACNKMNLVIVPSNFTKSVIENTGVTNTPIKVVPECYNENLFSNSKDTLDLKTDFNFLMISQLNSNNTEDDRKNIFNSLKWFCEEFKDNDDVGLVLKTNMGRGTTIDKKITQQMFRSMLDHIGKKQFPKIYLVHGNMKKKDMAIFYNDDKIKCYATATRGEGFGLPIIDAAAAGIPIVATNWSAHTEYLQDKYSKVGYTLKEIRKEKVDQRIFLEGFQWANPDGDDFKKKIREVYENYEAVKKQATELQPLILENYSHENIKTQYDKIYKDLVGQV
jgi:glycosyltransferase involved in cell wall biosynthesis